MLLTELQMKAATDPAFRAAVQADPRAALAAEGLELPADVTVRVVESTPEELVVAIPPAVPQDVELSEEGLAGVSGGTGPILAVWFGTAFAGGALGGGVAAAIHRFA